MGNQPPQPGAPRLALVTGATGFIGSRMAAALSARGFRVRALVREGSRASDLGPGIEAFVGDLRSGESLAGIEQGVDVVVHSASLLGKWGTPESLLDEVNVRGVENLLRRFERTPLARFLHLSAGGVTGPVSGGPADETYTCRPATAYERTKLEGERLVLELGRKLGLPVVVARPTFTYGPGDPHKLALFRAIARGRYAFIGDGESVNHPVFIDDLIAGLLAVLERGRTGEIYIVGGDRPATKRELVYAIADALGVARPTRRIPEGLARIAATLLERAGTMLGFEPVLTRSRVMMMAADFGYSIAKARRELGYEPRTDLARGIAATVESYRAAGQL